MYSEQEGAISALSDTLLKLVDQFTWLNSDISSTESDVNICLPKAWNAIDSQSIIWKSNLSDRIKRDFFEAVLVSILPNGCISWTLRKSIEKKLEQHKNAACCLEQILEATHHKTAVCTATNLPSTNHPSKTNKTCEALPEKQGRTDKRRSLTDFCTWTPQFWPSCKDLQQLCLDTGCSSEAMNIRDGWWERERERERERESGNSVLSTWRLWSWQWSLILSARS